MEKSSYSMDMTAKQNVTAINWQTSTGWISGAESVHVEMDSAEDSETRSTHTPGKSLVTKQVDTVWSEMSQDRWESMVAVNRIEHERNS